MNGSSHSSNLCCYYFFNPLTYTKWKVFFPVICNLLRFLRVHPISSAIPCSSRTTWSDILWAYNVGNSLVWFLLSLWFIHLEISFTAHSQSLCLSPSLFLTMALIAEFHHWLQDVCVYIYIYYWLSLTPSALRKLVWSMDWSCRWLCQLTRANACTVSIMIFIDNTQVSGIWPRW